jgi:hypothetical protein
MVRVQMMDMTCDFSRRGVKGSPSWGQGRGRKTMRVDSGIQLLRAELCFDKDYGHQRRDVSPEGAQGIETGTVFQPCASRSLCGPSGLSGCRLDRIQDRK